MKLPSRAVASRVAWSVGSHGVAQVMRLANNIVLARLLAPELFGIMVIVNSVRTGIELLSDIGVGQNIIANKNADEPDFYNTAWTLQVVRGLVLSLICAAIAFPLGRFYGNHIIGLVLMLASLLSVLAGFESAGKFLIQKRLNIARYAVFEITIITTQVIIQIAAALISPTIWALVMGGIISNAVMMIGTYQLVPGIRHRFMINRDAAREIFQFGRWVFLSTAVYFFAANFDRLYMAKAVPLALLGVYGIARSLADVVNILMTRLGNSVIFPTIAASYSTNDELRGRLAHTRAGLLLFAAVGIGMFAAVSDEVVALLYDSRYHAAAKMLPLLVVGSWFGIVTMLNEAVMMGIGKPVYLATANAAKLAWLLAGLPLAFTYFGLPGAIFVVASAEAARFPPLWFAQKRERLSFARQDLLLTLVMLGVVVGVRSLLELAGLTGGPATLLPW